MTITRLGEIIPGAPLSPAAAAAGARTLTADCAHGPRGACHHCCPGDKTAPASPLNKAHRWGAWVCVSCLFVFVSGDTWRGGAHVNTQVHWRQRRWRWWRRR
jgi:hypothetical protein